MIEIGKKQELTVLRKVSFGAYLGETSSAHRGKTELSEVLLPGSQMPQGLKEGDVLKVFVYRDSSDRPIATTAEPALTLGEVKVLKVKEVTRIGAFLDWGLEKDLLLPFHEQTARVKAGDDCLAALYLDKSGRLCATMKVYHYLSARPPYQAGDTVTGRVYEISGNFGVFIAVDDRYSALIPKREAQGEYYPGQILTLRVAEVKEDGKLTVSSRKKAYLQMDDDAAMILGLVERQGGSLPFDDKASPEVIQQATGLSKNAFKRAVGRLLKEGKVSIGQGKISAL